MPSWTKTKTKAAAAAVARMPPIPRQLIDRFITHPISAKAVQEITMALNKA